MVGGDVDAFERTEPLLHQLGQSVTRVGENGKGVLLKLAINISLAVQTLAFSEGLLLAERGGVAAQDAARVMAASSIGSPMLKARIPLLLSLPETSWFTVRLMRKDIQLALAEADRLAVPSPSAAVAETMLATATDLGLRRPRPRRAAPGAGEHRTPACGPGHAGGCRVSTRPTSDDPGHCR